MIDRYKSLPVVKKNHTFNMIMPFQFQGIILVYDITTEDSFKHISQWLQNIQDVSKIFPHLLLVPFFFCLSVKTFRHQISIDGDLSI